MRSIYLTLLLLFALVASAQAVPFWGDKTSMPASTSPAALKPGQFVWDSSAVPSGPVVMIVSLTEQRGYVYRNGINVGVTTVSTGKPGHETPTGVFTILQKDKDHHSSIYNNASMPDTERLTWGGVALHAGGLPGYPSSHGCVHLPSVFAQKLFEITPMGMTVVIADKASTPLDVVHPPMFAPVSALTGAEDEDPRLASGEEMRWEPEKATVGPVSILISRADSSIIVFRNGVEIGRARMAFDNPDQPIGTIALMIPDEKSDSNGKPHWISVHTSSIGTVSNTQLTTDLERLHMPEKFKTSLAEILTPGTTMMITDLPVLESTTNVPLRVVGADPPNQKIG